MSKGCGKEYEGSVCTKRLPCSECQSQQEDGYCDNCLGEGCQYCDARKLKDADTSKSQIKYYASGGSSESPEIQVKPQFNLKEKLNLIYGKRDGVDKEINEVVKEFIRQVKDRLHYQIGEWELKQIDKLSGFENE